MSSQHQHQDNQKRHTNIVTVKLKIEGKKFEVAAYPNRVRDYRNGVETKLDDVLQVFQVFENVSRGIHAKTADLMKYFGTKDMEQCCKEILMKGDLQVSDRERQEEYESKFRDVATLVAGRCVNTQTGWPYTTASIETAMRDTIHFAVNPTRSIKLQAMEVIEKLKAHIPIARAKMHLRFSGSRSGELQEEIKTHESVVIKNFDTTKGLEILADPHSFRELEQLGKKFETTMSIMEFSVQATKETDLEDVVELGAATKSGVAAPSSSIATVIIPGDAATTTTPASGKETKAFKCSTCRVEFADAGAYRGHCKTEFHTYNLKLKQVGLPTVNFSEFTNMSEDDKKAVLFDWKQDE